MADVADYEPGGSDYDGADYGVSHHFFALGGFFLNAVGGKVLNGAQDAVKHYQEKCGWQDVTAQRGVDDVLDIIKGAAGIAAARANAVIQCFDCALVDESHIVRNYK